MVFGDMPDRSRKKAGERDPAERKRASPLSLGLVNDGQVNGRW